MLDHLELRTQQLDLATAFYARVLAPLGYSLKVDEEIKKGFGDDHGLDFFLVHGAATAEKAHYAFAAPTRALVGACFEAGRDAPGGKLDRPAALMPQVHAHYYASFLRDPDGRLVEFVCHAPE
ncbi:VOC family protein [Caulobacter sp. 17J65-9]|uniref:VOC family protein n=1 Tax=Caulobacter sp. 17J65-9 TaxID=2709382 RepID=UPI0013CC3334|nr:VOC family protein [Caulobacter sp. 17J65-9]NEX91790.1 hypothetical protein [Caulobacter sp. 17J65-9]